ncbi:MAG: SOS response-associated peptidase family protein [Candidatus Methylomirabilales bacterium]
MRLKDVAPFAFAGLWEHWERGEERIDSCSIIVTDATEALRDIHDRMPVILSPEHYDTWMDPYPGFLTDSQEKGRISWHNMCAISMLCAMTRTALWKHSVTGGRWNFTVLELGGW